MGVPVIEGGTAWDDVTGERSLANVFGKESAGVAPFDASSKGQFSGRFPTTHTPHNFPACPPSDRSTTPPAAHHQNHSPCGCNSQRAEDQSEFAAALGRARGRRSNCAGHVWNSRLVAVQIVHVGDPVRWQQPLQVVHVHERVVLEGPKYRRGPRRTGCFSRACVAGCPLGECLDASPGYLGGTGCLCWVRV